MPNTTPGQEKTSIGVLTLLVLSCLMFFVAYGLQITLVPIRAHQVGLPIYAVGLSGVALCLGFMTGSMLVPFIIRLLGTTRTFLLFAVTSSCLALIFIFLHNPVVFISVRVLSGFVMVSVLSVLEYWLSELKQRMGQSMGSLVWPSSDLCHMLQFFMLSLGQLPFALGSLAGDHMFVLLSLLFSLAMLPALMTHFRVPVASGPPPWTFVKPQDVFSLIPCALGSVVLAGVVSGQFWVFGSIFAYMEGFGTKGIALFICLSAMGGALAMTLGGLLLALLPKRPLFLLAPLLVASSSILLLLGDKRDSRVLLLLGSMLFGTAAFSLYTISMRCVRVFLREQKKLQQEPYVLTTCSTFYFLGAIGGTLFSSVAIYFLDAQMTARLIFSVPLAAACLFFIYACICFLTAPSNRDIHRL